ncbi:MAG: YcaO-like family protein [Methylobacteriaceae bacterium]|nr:YcaO-like family protein [Methylobacteriaceae bacterium]
MAAPSPALGFEEAVAAFRDLAGRGLSGGEVAPVLAAFGLEDWAHELWDSTGPRSYRAAAIAVAGELTRIFTLPSPDAPGLAFVGGTADPVRYGFAPGLHPAANVSGRGAEPEAAFLGCIGEAVEHLSRLAWGDEAIERRGGEPPAGLGEITTAALMAACPAGRSGEWIAARRLGSDEATALPVELVLSRPGEPAPASTGMGSGATIEAACLAGLLELVERDAAALWWHGGVPARPVAAEVLAEAVGWLLPALRSGATGRITNFLDLTSDLGVPVVAALSTGSDGRGLACGLAARPSRTAAVRAALLELGQMELAHRLVELKLARGGPAALAPVEERHRRRMALDAAALPLLAPVGLPRPADAALAAASEADLLASLADHLAGHGVEAVAVDLTRAALGIPAVRVVAPALQPLPLTHRTQRLDHAIARWGERKPFLPQVDLL